MKQLAGSIGLLNIRRNSMSATPFSIAATSRGDRVERRVVGFGARELEQLARCRVSPVSRLRQRADDAFERFALLAELLRALRIVPDLRIFELSRDLLESHRLHIEVKDTSAGRRCVRWSPASVAAIWLTCSASMAEFPSAQSEIIADPEAIAPLT